MNPKAPPERKQQPDAEVVTTTFKLRRDQWARLRREAEVLSHEIGGKPDASAALRKILDAHWEKAPPLTVSDSDVSELYMRVEEFVKTEPRAASLAGTKETLKQARAEFGRLPVTGAELKRFREDRLGISQSALARKLRVDTGTVSRWERSDLISPETKVTVATVALLMASQGKARK